MIQSTMPTNLLLAHKDLHRVKLSNHSTRSDLFCRREYKHSL